jgi:hypothetical protein
MTLLASQNINLLHLSDKNLIAFQTQIALSLLNCFIAISSAVSVLNGNVLGRTSWHLWGVLYFLINSWQLDNKFYLFPAAIMLLITAALLYARPAQRFFDQRAKQKRGQLSRRVDSTFNIFEE